MTRAIILVDLDDTLFQTVRKRPPNVPEASLTPIAWGADCQALGFATPRQMRMLSWLAETTRLVPVTARSLAALRRVRIPFTAAVCAHGGVLLTDDGEPCPDWARAMATAAAEHTATLDDLAAHAGRLSPCAETALTVRVQREAATPLYLLIKHPAADDDALARLVDPLLAHVPADWTVHRNGNNVALLPPFLGKAKAVARLLPRLRAAHPDAPVIGMGDSNTDAPFMALCDYAMTPTGSQLSARLLA